MTLAAIAIAIAAAVAPSRGSSPGREPRPAKWSVEADTLQIFDASGHHLWSYRFDFDFEETVSRSEAAVVPETPVLIQDVDGDGQPEVLAAARKSGRVVQSIYCFNSDGTVRFRYHPEGAVTFGSESFGGPWLVHRLVVLPAAAPEERPSVWAVFVHGNMFPSLLVELSASGRALSEYWSDGYIDALALVSWRGKPTILVGSTNNETRGASLAVFPRHGLRGSPPSEVPAYRCTSCNAGGPGEFFVFPRRCFAETIGGQPTVSQIWRDDLDRLHVLILEPPLDQRFGGAAAWYTIASDGRLAAAESVAPFSSTHGRLEQAGKLDHPYSAHGEASLLPVRRWAKDRYVDVGIASPSSAPSSSPTPQR